MTRTIEISIFDIDLINNKIRGLFYPYSGIDVDLDMWANKPN